MLKNKIMVFGMMLCIMVGVSACGASSSEVSTEDLNISEESSSEISMTDLYDSEVSTENSTDSEGSSSDVAYLGLSDTIWGTFEASDGSLISFEETYEYQDGTGADAMMIRSESSWLEEYVFVYWDDETTIQFIGTYSAYFKYTYTNYMLVLEDIESGDSKIYTKISDDYAKKDILDVSSLEAEDISGLYNGFTSSNKWTYIIDNGDKTVDVYYLTRDSKDKPIVVDKLLEGVDIEEFGANQKVLMRDPYREDEASVYFCNSVFLVTEAGLDNCLKADDSSEETIEITEMIMEAIDDFNAARNGEKYVSMYKPILDECLSKTQYALADINNNGIAELILLGSREFGAEDAIRVYQIKQNRDEAVDRGTEYFWETASGNAVTFYNVGESVVAKTSEQYKMLSLDEPYLSLENLDNYVLDSSATLIEFSSCDDLSLLYSWSSESEADDSYVTEDIDSEMDENINEDMDGDTDNNSADESSDDVETTWECDERYLGTWQDSVSQRCTMTITQGAEEYCIEINWSESAYAGYRWVFFGSYDDDIGGILYSGLCMYDDYSSGECESTVMWSEGEGLIYIVNDNYLCWDDYVEWAGDDCVFEKIE